MLSYYVARPSNPFLLRPSTAMGFNGGRRIPVDVVADDDGYTIYAAVPGLDANSLNVEILDDVVTLRGEVAIRQEEQERPLLREIAEGDFLRRLRMPDALDSAKAEAKVHNGILTLRIPKADAARPKTIEVKAG
jgi:HSP20 family protein